MFLDFLGSNWTSLMSTGFIALRRGHDLNKLWINNKTQHSKRDHTRCIGNYFRKFLGDYKNLNDQLELLNFKMQTTEKIPKTFIEISIKYLIQKRTHQSSLLLVMQINISPVSGY